MSLLGYRISYKLSHRQQTKVQILKILSSKGQYLGLTSLKNLPKNENVRCDVGNYKNRNLCMDFSTLGLVTSSPQYTPSQWQPFIHTYIYWHYLAQKISIWASFTFKIFQKIRMSEKRCNYNYDNPLTSRRTDGGKNDKQNSGSQFSVRNISEGYRVISLSYLPLSSNCQFAKSFNYQSTLAPINFLSRQSRTIIVHFVSKIQGCCFLRICHRATGRGSCWEC